MSFPSEIIGLAYCVNYDHEHSETTSAVFSDMYCWCSTKCY